VVKVTLKGLLAHKLRLALTALSVVLGVAFVSGTFVLTDTINRTFDDLFGEVSANIDVIVRAESGFGGDTGVDVIRDTIDERLLATVASVPGVHLVEGSVGGYAQIIKPSGEVVATTGAPTLGFNWGTIEEMSPLQLREGRAPERDGEVVIDVRTARSNSLAVGQQVGVIFRTGTDQFTVVGLTGFGTADNLAGATIAAFELRTAQRVFGKPGRFDTIDAAGDGTLTSIELRARVAAAMPAGIEVVTSDQVADEGARAVKQAMGFFGTALLTFAGISLFVGAFIIFNTFSILVAQRTRELALLRALGASRRQVLGTVLAEALVVGLVSSAVGLGLGVLFALGLQALLGGFGIDLPSTTVQFLPRTVVASFLVGTVVTLAAAVSPARRAARVAPVTAMRDGGAGGDGSLRRRAVAGGTTVAAGFAALFTGLFADLDNGLPLVGLGAGLTFIGVAMLSPLVARPLAGVIGAPLSRMGRMAGKLGRQNSMRSPRRTAAAATTLMIGLGLVGSVSVLSASIKESSTRIFDRSLAADFAINTSNFMPSISPKLAEDLATRAELGAVTELATGPWELDGARKDLFGATATNLRETLNLEMVEGDFANLARGQLLVEESAAAANGWSVGDTVPMTFARTGTQQVQVGGTYRRNELAGSHLISLEMFDANFTDRLDFVVLATVAPGVSADAARAAITEVAANYPNVTVRDQAEVKEENRRQIDQLLGLITALLALAIVIALFGIVNTLALSVFERTRELGLLRAVGMGRRQVRSMVRVESMITSVMGAILGLGVGVFFGWALQRALADEGIDVLVIPAGQLLSYVVLAALAGVLAAVWPARRAARLDVLSAITYE
jgi:putative ABC transport system permease protein